MIYTETPWTLDGLKIESGVVTVATVHNTLAAHENAVLLCAAPDLLAACKAMVAAFTAIDGDVPIPAEIYPVVESARAAIAKAEGK